MDERSQLSLQIDACNSNYWDLFQQIQEKQSVALAQGAFGQWEKLKSDLLKLNECHRIILYHHIADLENSPQMKEAISGFAKINNTIKTHLKTIKDFDDFVTAIGELVDDLNDVVDVALEKPPSDDG